MSIDISILRRKDLLRLPRYEWSLEPLLVENIYILPTRRKHENGFAYMISFAYIDGEPYILGEYHDVLEIKNSRVDCYKNGLIRFFPDLLHQGDKFKIRYRLSSFDAETISELNKG